MNACPSAAARRLTVLALLALLALSRSTSLAAAPDWFADLDEWLAAVDRHEAGQADEAAQVIAGWLPDRISSCLSHLLALRRAMAVFRDRPNGVIKLRGRPLGPAQVEALCRISRDERLRADLNWVLRRAALLHGDIGRFAPELPTPPGGRDVVVRMSDGRQTSVNQGTAHWAFGRDIVAALHPDDASVRFTIAWYRATAAYLQSDRQITLADQHLAQARRSLPDDPDILFAGACAVETLASRSVQAELATTIMPAGYVILVPPARTLEDQAIDLFAKVLSAEPDHQEARVRMARLVGLHGGHAAAAADLRRSLQAPLPLALAYAAWLFLGDEELALGNRAPAAEAYERAAELYPRAPSPVVALARLAREFGDREAVAAALQRWWSLPPEALDPWREFYFMQGADEEDLRRTVYRLAGGRQP
jgi:tetratricopeptide (TPR) repeat protein